MSAQPVTLQPEANIRTQLDRYTAEKYKDRLSGVNRPESKLEEPFETADKEVAAVSEKTVDKAIN